MNLIILSGRSARIFSEYLWLSIFEKYSPCGLASGESGSWNHLRFIADVQREEDQTQFHNRGWRCNNNRAYSDCESLVYTYVVNLFFLSVIPSSSSHVFLLVEVVSFRMTHM